jgi:hypothetical protein
MGSGRFSTTVFMISVEPRDVAAAAGVIEGACRHLVQDRMGITGARSMLWLRVINASGGTSACRDWRITWEHQRSCQDGLGLAA